MKVKVRMIPKSMSKRLSFFTWSEDRLYLQVWWTDNLRKVICNYLFKTKFVVRGTSNKWIFPTQRDPILGLGLDTAVGSLWGTEDRVDGFGIVSGVDKQYQRKLFVMKQIFFFWLTLTGTTMKKEFLCFQISLANINDNLWGRYFKLLFFATLCTLYFSNFIFVWCHYYFELRHPFFTF